jgi:hypothetical protein
MVSSPAVTSPAPTLRLTSRVYPLQNAPPPDEETGWKSCLIFNGSTARIRNLSCHVSVLTREYCPHPLHAHEEEELLLLLSGEVDLIFPDDQDPKGEQGRRLKCHQLVYYPARFAHTFQTSSEAPANYLMLKWFTAFTETGSPLAFGQYDMFDPEQSPGMRGGFFPHLIFEGPTAQLQKLHCHTSTLTPGGGYDPHIDDYDVAIIVLEGEIETLGERVRPYGVIFYAAGEPHGMHNPGKILAKYTVFEFHGR